MLFEMVEMQLMIEHYYNSAEMTLCEFLCLLKACNLHLLKVCQ